MRITLVLLVAMAATVSGSCRGRLTSDGAPTLDLAPAERPVVALLPNSIDPSFVLYADGGVLFAHVTRDRPTHINYRATHLDMTNQDSVLARLGIGPAFFRLNSSYDMRPGVTDLGTTSVCVWRERKTCVAVRAGLNADGRASSETPPAFRVAYDSLVTFDAPDAVPASDSEVAVRLARIR
ncbi:MAG TPA: hypothetical protein VNV25_18645 [Gemmatimonadaceae bacterium]|nr:hypothetical protein [Gemmatimonadaceae bacterium]